ncbi:MAG: YIP1 family protein [Promethearchaeota archaeon]
MPIFSDLKKAWMVIAHPDVFFEEERGKTGYWPILRFFLFLNVILAVLTPVVNWFHFPCDIVHSGTNAQMGAYVMAPVLEAATGVSRYIWVGLLTYLGNVAKFPLLGLIYHLLAKLLRGKGPLLESFKVAIYATSPMLLFGWIPFFGLISGLWTSFLYVIAFHRLHDTPLGPTIALMNFFIGIQVVWAFLFGWVGSSVPW